MKLTEINWLLESPWKKCTNETTPGSKNLENRSIQKTIFPMDQLDKISYKEFTIEVDDRDEIFGQKVVNRPKKKPK